jgi:hypothetical protein
MNKKPCPKKKASRNCPTGTYVFDKKLGKVVCVSTSIPSVASKSSGRGECPDAGSCPAGGEMPSCGDGPCGMGPCGMGGLDGLD